MAELRWNPPNKGLGNDCITPSEQTSDAKVGVRSVRVQEGSDHFTVYGYDIDFPALSQKSACTG